MKTLSYLLTLCGCLSVRSLSIAATTSVSFDQNYYYVFENEGAISVTVVRSGDPNSEFTVEFATSSIEPGALYHEDLDRGPATPGIDFVAQDLILTFAAGETNKVVAVPILDNGTVDHEWRLFGIQLKNASAGVSVNPAVSFVTIRDNELPANFDWSFLPAVAPASLNFQRFIALKPDGTIVSVDVLSEPSTSSATHLTTARIVFLSEDGDATGTAEIRLQNDLIVSESDWPGLNGLVLQPDGKLLLTGAFTRVNGEPHNSLVRLNQDGSLDSAFQAGFGPVDVITSPSYASQLIVLAVFPNGHIVVNVVDHRADILSILVLGADGKFDPSFTPTKVSEEFCCDSVLGTTTQDGKILIFGGQGVIRLGLNGAVDDTFRPNLQVPANPDLGTNTTGTIRAVLSQADGRLIIAGDFTSVNGAARSYIARLKPDGSLDPSFKAELLHPFRGTAAILSGGSILVLSVNDFVEFDTDGQVKTRFTPPRNIIQNTAGYFLGRFALQSEIPTRILVLNPWIGANGVELGLARVLLERSATSVCQIMGETTDGGNRFREDIFAIYGNDDPPYFEFVVQRLGETTGPATVKFSTSDGTAKAGVDYVAQAGTLDFAPFETEKLVRVPLTELTNRESRVFFMSLSEATGATLSGQPPVPVMIIGKALPPGKITPLRMPNGGVALIFGEQSFEFESSSLVEVSSDLNTWLPSTGYRFKSSWNNYNAVVWIDNHSRFDSPRFYRVRENQP